MRSTISGIKSTFLGLNLKKSAFLLIRFSFALLSEFSRSSVGKMRQGIREGKKTASLRKVLSSSLGVLWSFLGSSLVCPWFLTRGRSGRYKRGQS